MSLRDIYSNNEPTSISLHSDVQGNGSGLENFHTTNPEDREPNNTGKIVGALAVALMIGVAGTALYASSGSASHAKPMVAANLPVVTPPPSAPVAAPAPQQDAMTTPSDANTSASNTAPVAAPAPVKTADAMPVKEKSVKAVRSAKVVDPVSPTPSPNDVAAITPAPAPVATPDTASTTNVPAQEQANAATPAAPELAQPTVQAPAEQATAPAAASPAPAAEPAPAAQPAPAPAQ